MGEQKQGYWRLVTHVGCGLALALALPELSQLWLGALGLAALALFNHDLAHVSNLTRFFRGLGFGLGYFGFALHWIGYAFFVDAESYLWMMPFAVGGLALFMAVFWAVGFLVAGYLCRLQLAPWLSLPVGLAVMEWLRGYLFTGFPWAAPGLIADGMGPVLQLASVVGMPGLTLLVIMWGMAVGAVFQRQRIAWLVLASLPLGLVWGQWRLSSAPQGADTGPLIRVVQPNISQSDKWRSENTEEIFSDLLNLTASPGPEAPRLVIWPESAVSFLLDENAVALSRIGDVLGPEQTLLTGSLRRSVVGDAGENYYTSIHMIDGNGVVRQSYDKWRLVPGGEYLPFAWALEPLGFRKVVDLPESFTAGRGPQSMEVPGVGLSAMLICYEAIFPHRLLAEGPRPRLIVNVTNDGWFGNSVGPYQHLAQVRMRAVEQGIAVARSANTGISALIDPWGRYVARTEILTRSAFDVRVPAPAPLTSFAQWGAFVTWTIGFLVWAASLLFRPRTSSDQ